MKLSDYRKKRDPSRTNEPFGEEPERAGATYRGVYVVHLHDATRRHYDLRLEASGALMSFAVPKGPSLDPKERRLAVHTEDHPLEYLDFEAVIPEKNYGAGPMIAWDRGRVEYLERSAEEGLRAGKIDFVLHGQKLKGRYALVKTKGGEREWLLLKKTDAYSSEKRDITVELPRSILSGLTVHELSETREIGRTLTLEAARLGAKPGKLSVEKLEPMLCAPADRLPTKKDFFYELKLDGVRAIVSKSDRGPRILGRTGRDFTLVYPEIARAIRALPPDEFVLDGEVIAFDGTGKPNFQLLGRRMHLSNVHEIERMAFEVPASFIAFDILAIGDQITMDLPLRDRKGLLAKLLPARGVISALDHLEGEGARLFEFCTEHGLEGVVAKRASSVYRPGVRSALDWLKIKCEREGDFVVVGFTRGQGARKELGALDLASFEGGNLVYRGKVGSGVADSDIHALLRQLSPLAVSKPTAVGNYNPAPRGRTHVEPKVVVNVRHMGLTEDGHLRHPVYRGIRVDVDPLSCSVGTRLSADGAPEAYVKPATFAISNPDKVLFPNDGFTKADLCQYYEEIAPFMLPHLNDRPVMVVRYPDGINGKSFYQWNVPSHAPSWVKTFRLTGLRDESRKEDRAEVFLVNDVETLRYVANLAAIPLHILACHIPNTEFCDFLTIDLDVELSSFDSGVILARGTRDLAESVGLRAFVKTSGQTGLHVLVPLGPDVSHDSARTLADLLGRLLVARFPSIATMERIIAKRGARVYVDTGQTGPGRTIVAPYAVRAYPGAPVSTPLEWTELRKGIDPSKFNLKTVIDRVNRKGDPLKGLLDPIPEPLARVLPRIEALVRPAT